MKMIFVVINNDDAGEVLHALNQAHISATKLSSTGGFLSKGNTTILSGVEDDVVDKTISIIKENSQTRKQVVPIHYMQYSPGIPSYPVEITVGGATIFVMNIERFEKV